jgi:hypothetical protein
VVPVPIFDRDVRIEAEPGVFFVNDHYVAYPYALVRLANMTRTDLRELLQDACG